MVLRLANSVIGTSTAPPVTSVKVTVAANVAWTVWSVPIVIVSGLAHPFLTPSTSQPTKVKPGARLAVSFTLVPGKYDGLGWSYRAAPRALAGRVNIPGAGTEAVS